MVIDFHESTKKSDALFTFFAIFFCVNLVITNVIAAKLFRVPFFPSVALSVADLTYPVTFLITDIVTEIWGKRRANFIVMSGFAMNLFMLIMVQIALHLPGHEIWVVPNNPYGYAEVTSYQLAYKSVFAVSGSLVFGSMVAYMLAQLLDIRLFHFLRKKTNGRHLWLRNNVATIVSQLLDTSVLGIIFLYFGLGLDGWTCLRVSMYSYAFKVFFALCDTPFCYLGVMGVKRLLKREKEGEYVKKANAVAS